MTLKQQIEATIQAYEEACKPENLNWSYCFFNDINSGLCYYTKINKFTKLFDLLTQKFKQKYICLTPNNIFINYNDRKVECKEIHQTRINYLKNLLNSLPND